MVKEADCTITNCFMMWHVKMNCTTSNDIYNNRRNPVNRHDIVIIGFVVADKTSVVITD